jgi:hypothetical protein
VGRWNAGASSSVVLACVAGCSLVIPLDDLGPPDASKDGATETGPDAPSDVSTSDVSDGGAGAIRLLGSTITDHNGSADTTPAFDTTGATLIVIGECRFSGVPPPPPTDSKGNTWHALVPSVKGPNNTSVQMFYAFAPATSASHTFTDPDTSYSAIAVLAFSGTRTDLNVYDQSTTAASSSQTGQPGSLTPTQVGELAVTFACSGQTAAPSGSINDGFDLVQYVYGNTNGSNAEDEGAAYYITPSVDPINPTWSLPGDTQGVTSAIATFRY